MRKPIYDPDYHIELIAELTRKGHTDKDIAKIIGIHESTLYDWRNKYPELSEAVVRARRSRSQKHCLPKMMKRAKGYQYREKYYARDPETGNMRLVKEIVKHMPPDVAALKFFISHDLEEYKESVKIEHSAAIHHTAAIPPEILEKLQIAHRQPSHESGDLDE